MSNKTGQREKQKLLKEREKKILIVQGNNLTNVDVKGGEESDFQRALAKEGHTRRSARQEAR